MIASQRALTIFPLRHRYQFRETDDGVERKLGRPCATRTRDLRRIRMETPLSISITFELFNLYSGRVTADTSSAGINRHVVGGASPLQERK